MANELETPYQGTATLYAIIRRTSDGKVWNGSAFETFVDGSVASYDVPLTSQGGDYYAADFPDDIDAGTYRALYYVQAGGSPAITDLKLPNTSLVAWTGSGIVTPGSGAGTMTLTTARDWLVNAVADAKDVDLFSPTDLDRAIYCAGETFCRMTRCLKRVDTIAIAASNNSVSLAGSPTTNGFRPERLIDGFLSGFEDPINVIDYTELNAAVVADSALGIPVAMAFLDWTTAEVWPVPDIAYTLKIRYWLAFNSWAFGTSSPDSVTLNLPTDYLPRVLSEGAASVLTAADKKNQFGTVMGQRFLQYVESMKGAGNLGARVVFRNKLE